MAGKSGGVCILSSQTWKLTGVLDDLELAVPATCVAKGSYEARNGAGSADVVAYYGHPAERQRTVEDLRIMETYAWSTRRPLLVLGDFNIGEEEYLGAAGGLADIGAWWAVTQEQNPEPTFVPPNGRRPTRVDRIWLQQRLLHNVLNYKVTDEINAPGHRTLRMQVTMRPTLTITSTAGKMIKADNAAAGERAHAIEHILVSWRLTRERTMDIGEWYDWWALTWENYLSGGMNTACCRNKLAPLRQEVHASWQPQLPLRMRKLEEAIKTAATGKAPGPDSWRYEEL